MIDTASSLLNGVFIQGHLGLFGLIFAAGSTNTHLCKHDQLLNYCFDLSMSQNSFGILLVAKTTLFVSM
jgi:hypothetical protein